MLILKLTFLSVSLFWKEFQCFSSSGVLGFCRSFQRSSRCATQFLGTQLQKGSSGTSDWFWCNNIWWNNKNREKWATPAQATASTLWPSLGKLWAEHQPGFVEILSLTLQVTMRAYWNSGHLGQWYLFQDIKITSVFSQWKPRRPHWPAHRGIP